MAQTALSSINPNHQGRELAPLARSPREEPPQQWSQPSKIAKTSRKTSFGTRASSDEVSVQILSAPLSLPHAAAPSVDVKFQQLDKDLREHVHSEPLQESAPAPTIPFHIFAAQAPSQEISDSSSQKDIDASNLADRTFNVSFSSQEDITPKHYIALYRIATTGNVINTKPVEVARVGALTGSDFSADDSYPKGASEQGRMFSRRVELKTKELGSYCVALCDPAGKQLAVFPQKSDGSLFASAQLDAPTISVSGFNLSISLLKEYAIKYPQCWIGVYPPSAGSAVKSEHKKYLAALTKIGEKIRKGESVNYAVSEYGNFEIRLFAADGWGGYDEIVSARQNAEVLPPRIDLNLKVVDSKMGCVTVDFTKDSIPSHTVCVGLYDKACTCAEIKSCTCVHKYRLKYSGFKKGQSTLEFSNVKPGDYQARLLFKGTNKIVARSEALQKVDWSPEVAAAAARDGRSKVVKVVTVVGVFSIIMGAVAVAHQLRKRPKDNPYRAIGSLPSATGKSDKEDDEGAAASKKGN